MPGFNLLNDILQETLVCACNILMSGLCDQPASNCGCPCRLFISAGPPVWDNAACCSDGQLTVHAENVRQFSNFPAGAQGANFGCQVPLMADIVVTLLRCFPNLNDDGSAPTGPVLNAASEQAYYDLLMLTSGLICCLQEPARQRKFTFNGARIAGPQGGCIGVEIRFSVELFSL